MSEQTDVKRAPLPKSWRETYPKRYLHAEDLKDGQGGYRNFDLEIKEVENHIVKGKRGDENRLTVYFTKGNKPLLLNVTMCKFLAGLSGKDNPVDWKGLKVNLFVQKQVHVPRSDEHPTGKADVIRLRARAEIKQGTSKGVDADAIEPAPVNLEDLADDEFDEMVESADLLNEEIDEFND